MSHWTRIVAELLALPRSATDTLNSPGTTKSLGKISVN